MTSTCFFFFRNGLKLSESKNCTSLTSSDQWVSGGGGGGGSEGSFMKLIILSATRTFTSNLNSPLTKYLTEGYPCTPCFNANCVSLVPSSAASTPGIYKLKHQFITKTVPSNVCKHNIHFVLSSSQPPSRILVSWFYNDRTTEHET